MWGLAAVLGRSGAVCVLPATAPWSCSSLLAPAALGTLSTAKKKLFVPIFPYIYMDLTGLGRAFEGQRTCRGHCAGNWEQPSCGNSFPAHPSLSLYFPMLPITKHFIFLFFWEKPAANSRVWIYGRAIPKLGWENQQELGL